MNLPTINPATESQRIVDFISSTFQKVEKRHAAIALSGGVDSALALMLAGKALGPASIHAYYLPSKTSRPIHQEDAQAAAAAVGLPAGNFHILPIGAIIQKTWRIIKRHENEAKLAFFAQHPEPADSAARTVETKNADEAQQNRLRLANIAARIRMMVIFDAPKKLDALVIGTENYSEHLLGYFTRFGDEASDVEPIGHLYKTHVIELAKYLQLPKRIIEKPASADLWPGQTDANELGFTYEQADPILYLIGQGQQVGEIISAGFDQNLVEKVFRRVQASVFKHQVPYRLLGLMPATADNLTIK